MSKREEKQQELALLSDKLRQMRVHELPAAKNVMKELERASVTSSLVEDVRIIIETALHHQKEKIRRAIDKI